MNKSELIGIVAKKAELSTATATFKVAVAGKKAAKTK